MSANCTVMQKLCNISCSAFNAIHALIQRKQVYRPMSLTIAYSIFAKRQITEVVEFQAFGPATENARRPNLVRRCHGTMSWWRLGEWSHWQLATSVVDLQQSTGYWLLRSILPCRHRWGFRHGDSNGVTAIFVNRKWPACTDGLRFRFEGNLVSSLLSVWVSNSHHGCLSFAVIIGIV